MTLDPDSTTVLDVVAAYPATEAVFRRRDTEAGCRLLCQGLFETISGLATRFDLDREALVADLLRVMQKEKKR
ncbi:MAG: hypothetical protein AB9872_01055 [Solidesulfovibrio sp.]